MIGYEDFEGLNGPTFKPAPLCSSCGEEVYYEGGTTGWCSRCMEYRDIVSSEEFEEK